MIDRSWIGRELPAAELSIDRTRLRFFAQAIGETNPVYTELAAAHAAGYPDLPAPPTFVFAAELDAGVIDRLLADIGLPLEKLLHGEQGFSWRHPICAGDIVTVRSRIDDIYDKKNGTLEFVVKTSSVTNQHGVLVGEMRSVLICRH